MGGKRGEAWPLVGRAAELHRLHDLVSASDSPGVMIAGPAGVGKTRLALECLRLAEGAGMATARVTATREKMLPAKLKLDIDKKMLRAIISDDLPAAVKEATMLTLKIEPAPGSGVTLTSSFELKGEMTLAEALDKLCADKSWGWYVNIGKIGPIPNLYDPYWAPSGKVISVIAEIAAAIAAAALFVVLTSRTRRTEASFSRV